MSKNVVEPAVKSYTEEQAYADPEGYMESLTLAEQGKRRLEKWELRLIVAAAYFDATVVLQLFPAEAVPEEIEGAWRELRAAMPLQQQVEDFINS